MKTHRIFAVAVLAGVLLFTSVQGANAMDPYYQDLLSNMLSGLVSGTPYGSYSGPSGTPPYGPYGNPSGGSYGAPPYGPYGNSPYYGPHELNRGGYYEPERGSSGPYPYDPSWSRDSRYRYQEHLGNLNEKYDKAMQRLDRQQYEASAKAYRKSSGDPSRYSEEMAKIDRKYDYKRYKVERNTGRDYRKLSGRY